MYIDKNDIQKTVDKCINEWNIENETELKSMLTNTSNAAYAEVANDAFRSNNSGDNQKQVLRCIAEYLGKRSFLFFLRHPFVSTLLYRKIEKRNVNTTLKLILMFLTFIVAIGGMATGGYFIAKSIVNNYRSKINENTINLICEKKYNELPLVERTYGDLLDVSSIKVAYQYNSSSDWHYYIPSLDSVIQYDSEKIGYQTSLINFSSKYLEFYVNTHPLEINTPILSLKQEERKITWKGVAGAEKYKVLCGTSSDELTYLDETTALEYDLSKVEQVGNLFFAVQAIKESEKYSDSRNSNLVNVLKLPSAESLTYIGSSEEKMISWTSVPYADYYTLTIDGHTNDNITDTSFAFDAPSGEHEVLLTAHSNLVNSIYSETSFSFAVLDQVTGLRITDSYLEWDEVNNATSYDVYLNNSASPVNVSTNKLSIVGMDAGLYSISVIAKNISSNVYDSHISAEYSTLINFKIELHNNVLSWPDLGDKFNYYVYVDNEVATSSVVTNTFDFRTMNLASGSHNVKVLAKHRSMTINNDFSNVIEFTKLSTPTLSISNNIVVAEGSDVPVSLYIDGVEFDGSLVGISADNHTITGRYFAATDLQIDSEVGYLQIAKLSTPVLTIYNEKITCDYPARTIKYYLDGVEFDGSLVNIAAGEHQITARYIGNGSTVIDSDLSEAKSITKIEAPILTIANEVISYDQPSQTIKYYLDGDEFDGNLAGITTGEHQITARYIGNGVTILNSELSAPKVITKLDNPILTIADEVISCNYPDRTIKYYLDGDEFDGNLSGISVGEHQITARYIGNGSSVMSSELSEVKTITKLSAPVLTIYDEMITCDYPARTIKYYLDGVEFDGGLEDISAGEHQITARYIGNGSNILTSELSEVKTITKLDIPVLKYENHEIICTKNNINLEYFDGESVFSGLYEDLTRGYHLVSARNVGDGVNTISSKVSSSIEVYRTDATVIYNKIDNEKFIVRLTTQDNVVAMSLSAKFYLNDVLIDSVNYPDVEEFYQTIRLKRSSGTADRVEIVATILISCEQGNFTDVIYSQYIPL